MAISLRPLFLLSAAGCIYFLVIVSRSLYPNMDDFSNSNLVTRTKPINRVQYKENCIDCCGGLKLLTNNSIFAANSDLFCITFSPHENSFYLSPLTTINPFFSFYVGMAIDFLGEVLNHENLASSTGGEAVWIITDDGTMSANLIEILSKFRVPFLTHSIKKEHRSVSVMVPNFHYIQHRGFRKLTQNLMLNEVNFEDKEKIVFWRGSSTGYGNCEALPRVVAARKSKQLPWLDIKISKLVQACNGREVELTTEGIYSDFVVPEIDWVEHRGILDIDGNVDAWGYAWRLQSGSVVFQVLSPYVGFFTEKLIQNEHFIPISADLSDLANVTSIVKSNDTLDLEKMKKIINNGISYSKQFTYDKIVGRVADELDRTWGCT